MFTLSSLYVTGQIYGNWRLMKHITVAHIAVNWWNFMESQDVATGRLCN